MYLLKLQHLVPSTVDCIPVVSPCRACQTSIAYAVLMSSQKHLQLRGMAGEGDLARRQQPGALGIDVRRCSTVIAQDILQGIPYSP